MLDKKEIAVIIPVYNESKNIRELVDRIVKSIKKFTDSYQIVFVNDGSRDDSQAKLIALCESNNQCYYISFSRNFGHQIAVSAGLEYTNANCTVIIDGDLQDPPELIPELYQKYKEGFDVVYAKREKRQGETILKKITAKLFYRMLENITSFSIPLDVGDFRLIDKKVVTALNNMPEQHKFLRGQIAWLGYKSTDVSYIRDSRKYGRTNYSYGKMFKLAFDAITGFSDKPLRFMSRMGFVISFISFLIIIYAMISHFILDKTVTGWTSLIISFSFIGGIQLLSIGLIGEYISRISTDVKKRPMYIISETNID